MKLHEKWRKGEVQVVCATIGIVMSRTLVDESDNSAPSIRTGH